jgi:hypothetical protein
MTDLLETIRKAWGWRGIAPTELIAINAFGNVIVRDRTGEIWRICPEELDAKKIAHSQSEYEALRDKEEFAEDWDFAAVRLEAEASLGEPGEGRCYCLKIPAILGGKYADDNLGTISISELLSVSGSMAFQIKDIPDGAKVRLVVQDSN